MVRDLIGSRIRARREAIGLKQRDVARRAGISASYLNLIEHNRRAIAGKLLLDIAAALNVTAPSLQEGADSDLVRQMQTAAGFAPQMRAEVEKVQDMVSRFPGWSALVGNLQQRVARLERALDGLSDRLAHDPFLAETMHEILSSVTAIHATSGILAQTPAMEGLQQRRFQTNIYEESTRLSDLSRGLVSYFDRLAEPERTLATPLDEADVFLARHGYHFASLESGGSPAIAPLLAQAPEALTKAARDMLRTILARYVRDARRLPLDPFLAAARQAGFDCRRLAETLAAPLDVVQRRLAFLPTHDPSVPDIGLITCDASGAILLRKAIVGFALPRYGAACALWPLYQAMMRPHVPLSAALQTTEARIFRAEALAIYPQPAAAVPVLRSTMIIRAQTGTGAQEAIKVGQSCRICSRQSCQARREPSIHALAD